MDRNNSLFVIKRIIAVILVLAVLAVDTAICVNCESCIQADIGSIIGLYEMGDSDFAVLSDIDGCYSISLVTNGLDVRSINTQLKINECFYTYNNNRFAFALNDHDFDLDKDILILTFYSCVDDYFFQRAVVLENSGFCSAIAFDSEGSFYIANHGAVDVYDNNLLYIKTLELPAYVKAMIPDSQSGEIYCITNDNIYIICGDEIKEINAAALEVYPANGGFSDENGTLYNSEGDVLYSGFSCTHGSVIFGDYFLGIKDGMLTAVNGEEERPAARVCDNSFLCANNKQCLIAEQGYETKLGVYTLNEIEELFAEPDSGSDSRLDANTDQAVYETPTIYNESFIVGIPQGCTAARFRSIYGDDYVFYKPDGSIKKSGILGTGIRAFSQKDEQQYIIVIFGDLSGDGKIGEKDKTLMTKILFGSISVDDEFMLACDADHNSTVDLSDLTAIALCLEDDYTISQMN